MSFRISAVLLLSMVCTAVAFADIQSAPVCDPATMATAPAGYTCQAGDAQWRVDSATYEGHRVYLDLKSRLRVTEPLGTSDHFKALTRCREGFWLPTGYGSDVVQEMRKQGYLLKDSDFTQLFRDHFESVVPGVAPGPRVSHPWFWTGTSVLDGLAYIYFSDDRTFRLWAEITRSGQMICVGDYAPTAAVEIR